MKTIEVAFGILKDSATHRKVRLPAEVIGAFAVHRPIKEEEGKEPGFDKAAKHWRITHVSTGYGIANFSKKQDAVRVLKRLKVVASYFPDSLAELLHTTDPKEPSKHEVFKTIYSLFYYSDLAADLEKCATGSNGHYTAQMNLEWRKLEEMQDKAKLEQAFPFAASVGAL